MIARLKGIVDAVETDSAIIDVNGVGYLVQASSRTLARLNQGDAVSFWIETHVREDNIQLFGFLSADEKNWFRLLTTVQGVGAKVGLAMLSALTGDMLLQAIAAGDKAAICQAPGVGPKLATRILSELKDKVGGMALGEAAQQGVASAGRATGADPPGDPSPGADAAGDLLRDAASALVNLGYTPSEALSAVSRAAQKAENDGTVDLTLESLIRLGLADLVPHDQRRGA